MAIHEIERLISRLRYLLKTAQNVVSCLTEEEMGFQTTLAPLTRKEILGQLITIALQNQLLFDEIIMSKNDFLMTPIVLGNKDINRRFGNQNGQILLSHWISLNEQIIMTMENIPSSKLAHTVIDTDKQEEFTFLWIIKNYVNRVEHKLEWLFHTQLINQGDSFEKTSLTTIENKLTSQSLPFIKIFEKDRFVLEYYRPKKVDNQSPHTQDEIYIIISGTGQFLNGSSLYQFKAQDVFYVKAGVHHKFINFTDDFKTWVIFF